MKDISSIEDLVKIVKLDVIPQFGRTWWRGQPADKELLPKAYRNGATHRMEWRRASEFMQRAGTRHPRVPVPEDWAGWLFLMQHYRLPTRLLDWTESPLIACFFAAREDNSIDGCLWALSPEYLNVCQDRVPDLAHPDSISEYFRAPFLEEESADQASQMVIAVLTAEIDFRMLQQQSAFTMVWGRCSLRRLGIGR